MENDLFNKNNLSFSTNSNIGQNNLHKISNELTIMFQNDENNITIKCIIDIKNQGNEKHSNGSNQITKTKKTTNIIKVLSVVETHLAEKN
ncbi:unnamed protein product [Gordionus sp. m RMFG-2023]